jgi:hypothetical protein
LCQNILGGEMRKMGGGEEEEMEIAYLPFLSCVGAIGRTASLPFPHSFIHSQSIFVFHPSNFPSSSSASPPPPFFCLCHGIYLPPPKLLLTEGGSAREDNKNWKGTAAGGYMGGFLLSPAAAVAGRKTWLFLWPREIPARSVSSSQIRELGRNTINMWMWRKIEFNLTHKSLK